MPRPLPADHVRRMVGDTELVAHTSVVDALHAALTDAGTLYAWAGECPQPRALRGRAPVFVATLPDTRRAVAVRHAWHGGLLAPLTGDRWLRPVRAERELRRSLALHAAGIATAPVLGYALYPAGLGLARVDVVSEFLDHSYDLGAVLVGLAPRIEIVDALDATRTLLAQLAAYRLVHPDLNVKNILLRMVQSTLVAVVIDVDVMRHRASATPLAAMQANANRLARSMTKWQRHEEARIDEAAIAAFRRSLDAATPADGRPLPAEWS